MNKKIVSFPHLANYVYPIKFLLKKTTNVEVREAPKITKQTLEIGSKYSPDAVCLPFKYNLGNFIESLENGANVLMQAGGGCRYGYYAEVQEQILRDLGYDFEFISLAGKNGINPISIYKALRKLNKRLCFIKYIYYLILFLLFVIFMDNIDVFYRENVAFEEEKGSFDKLRKHMLYSFSRNKGIFSLIVRYFKYKKLFKKIKINKPGDCLKVGVVGELYGSMEGNASLFLEKKLADMGISVRRYTNATYLILTKRFQVPFLLETCRDYCKYELGADGMDNVARSIILKEDEFDGIIHIKPFGCIPEISAVPILQKYKNDSGIPMLFLTFDVQTSEEGLNTRLEAFYEMLKMRKGK